MIVADDDDDAIHITLYLIQSMKLTKLRQTLRLWTEAFSVDPNLKAVAQYAIL